MVELILIILWLAAFYHLMPRRPAVAIALMAVPLWPFIREAWRASTDFIDWLFWLALFGFVAVIAALLLYFLMGIPEMIMGRD